MKEVAADAGVTTSHFRRVLRMNFLAPEIVEAILRGERAVDINAHQPSSVCATETP